MKKTLSAIVKNYTPRDTESLNAYLNKARNYPLLSADEEKSLSETVKHGGKAAAKAVERLICSNLLLVVSIAKQYMFCHVPLEDLIQDGNIGLTKAARDFDGSMGNRFSTYAAWLIRKYITEGSLAHSGLIHLPRNVMDALKKHKQLSEQTHGEFSIADFAEFAGISEENARFYENYVTNNIDSIDTPFDDEDGVPTTRDIACDSFIADLEATDSLQHIDEQLKAFLTPHEYHIVSRSYGINCEQMATMLIANELNATEASVRKTRSHAISKLRKHRECFYRLAA